MKEELNGTKNVENYNVGINISQNCGRSAFEKDVIGKINMNKFVFVHSARQLGSTGLMSNLINEAIQNPQVTCISIHDKKDNSLFYEMSNRNNKYYPQSRTHAKVIAHEIVDKVNNGELVYLFIDSPRSIKFIDILLNIVTENIIKMNKSNIRIFMCETNLGKLDISNLVDKCLSNILNTGNYVNSYLNKPNWFICRCSFINYRRPDEYDNMVRLMDSNIESINYELNNVVSYKIPGEPDIIEVNGNKYKRL